MDPTLKPEAGRLGRLERIFQAVERGGNALPDPFVLFVILAAITILASALLAAAGAGVSHPSTGEPLPVRSLLGAEGLTFMLGSMLTNFTGFAPLGLVLVIMLGIGLAEKVGMLNAAANRLMSAAPRRLVTYVVTFAAINMSIASDAAMILLPPIAAMVFLKAGRHPVAGFVAGFACAGAGFTANLLIVGTDVLYAGLTTEAARILDPEAVVTPVANWYFNIVSVFVFTVIGAILTERFIEPRLGPYRPNADEGIEAPEESPLSGRGLRNAGIATLLYLAAVCLMLFWPGSPLRNEEGGLVPSPFLSSIVPFIFLYFMTVAITYGISVGSIRTSRDMTSKMAASVAELAPYIVLIFAIAQFIAYFNWSRIGTLMAVNGAEFLVAIEFTGFAFLFTYSAFSALLEFFITSGSAKWALEAPIFVPLLMQLGYDPGFIQIPYRVADSSFNIIAPTNPYLVIALSFLQRYDKEAGLGTLIALMLPYALTFFVVWQGMVAVFYFLGLPVGPGVYPMAQ